MELRVSELSGYSFHFTGKSVVNHQKVLEYIARKNDEPVDRFHVFFAGGEWNAWTADTLSDTTARIRRTFAAILPRNMHDG